jgi:AhpD family alkylhydroperoxidase
MLARWRAGNDMRGMHLLGTLARHQPLARALLTFNAHIARALPPRERELLILRISWQRRCEYEFTQHLILGRRAGLTEEELARLRQAPEVPGWSEADADLLIAVDELHEMGTLSERICTALSGGFDIPQMMDLVLTVGCYRSSKRPSASAGASVLRACPVLEQLMV